MGYNGNAVIIAVPQNGRDLVGRGRPNNGIGQEVTDIEPGFATLQIATGKKAGAVDESCKGCNILVYGHPALLPSSGAAGNFVYSGDVSCTAVSSVLRFGFML